jgi:hypothetical protein
MFTDSIKKMAFNQLREWMQKEKINELKISFNQKNELEFMEAKQPARFIHTDEIDAKLNEYKAEFTRLRREISLRDEEILTLKNK